MSETDVTAKFMSNAARRLPGEQAQQLAKAVEQLDQLDRISPILDACTAAAP